MASGTRLARMKMLEDDSASKRRTRKLVKLSSLSPSQKKLGSTGKKIPESPVRRSVRTERVESSSTSSNSKSPVKRSVRTERVESTNTSTNSRKCSNPITSKNRKVDENIGPSSSSDKAKKITSPQTKKRKVAGQSVSSNARDFTGSASPQDKKRKMSGKDIVLGANDMKSDESGKMKTIRKHLHVRTYKKLVKRQTSKCVGGGGSDLCLQEDSPLQMFLSDLGANISNKQECGDGKRNLQDDGDTGAETVEPLDREVLTKTGSPASDFDTHAPCDELRQDNLTKSSIKYKKRVPCGTSVESPGKDMQLHEICVVNGESSSPIIEEHGVSDSEVRYDDSTEKNSNIDLKECSFHSQFVVALIPDICLVCKQPGQLMSCFGRGCKRSYHVSCLDRLLPGAWLCNFCVKKKLESDVYSISEGIESVWDVDKGVQNGKRYFVKYKGLSHSHNRWIPESELLHEAPSLIAKFRKKGQKEVTKWRQEWTEPERLLQKNLVVLPETSYDCTLGPSTESSNCCIEWFVKWKGLEYDQATWELEKSLLLGSSEAPRLVEEYEHRREQAKSLHHLLRRQKVLKVKKDPFYRLTELPEGCPTELGSDLLGSLNRLREFWHKSVNAVLIDDQERFTKSILFVLSLQCFACQPSLVIATSGSLPLWQAEFRRLAPSLNVIMYGGDKDVRKMIRNVEFYEESGCLMFQVLLADHEAIIEDFEDINCIDWDVVIIDKCQNSKMFRYLEQLKSLNADFKLLPFNLQMKDNLSDYRILLSFLLKGGTVDDDLAALKADDNEAPGALAAVKEKLAHHIVYERKPDSSSFVEYWVPVPFSNVQLEQYCATLLSNSNVLRSMSKSDVVGALHSILVATRKCCDHPYLVDGELRCLLIKGLQSAEFLNAEVRASGKLFLLDKVLQEMKSRGLRVVILFQSLGGPGKFSLGDILDDFLQQRFGVDSYERIETGLVMAKKVAALKMFNNKESGRFVFLIEKRACLPSVKLHFVDAVILFDSDWNPLNDLRSLQKISIESQHNCIKVFRLYTAFTVEERLLMFAKQSTFIDSNVESISRNITQSLLGWGASYLFRKLDQFHSSSTTACISEPSFDKLRLNDVILEILSEFPEIVEISRIVPRSIVMKAQQSGAGYTGNIILVGEKEANSLPDKDMPCFWSGLLEARYRRWIHICDRTQRIRRKVHNFDGFIKRNETDSEMKKRRKINIVDPVTSSEFSQKSVSSKDGFHNSTDTSDAQKSHIVESEEREPKLEEQRSLLRLLRPELSKLCDILGLPASVEGKAQEFLDYIMNNHDVCSKQVTVLQALKISLCWRAASMSRHRLDRIESLAIARNHLKYECTAEEVYSVYSRLRILKEKFSCPARELDNSVGVTLENQSSGLKKVYSGRKSQPGNDTELTVSETSGLIMTGGAPADLKFSENIITPKQGHLNKGTPLGSQLNGEFAKDELLKNLIDVIEKVSIKRAEDLSHKHQAEVLHFEKQMFEERVQLEGAHALDLKFVRSIHVDLTVINGKINLLTQEFSSKMGRFCQHLKQQKAKLLSMQLDIRSKEQELKHSWLVKAKTSQLEESFDNLPLLETGFRIENFKETSKYLGNGSEFGTIILNSSHPSNGTNVELLKAPTGESIESEEYCHEVASNISSGSLGNVTLSDEALTFQSGMSKDMRPIKHGGSSVESSTLPGLASVLPMNAENQTPQMEVMNQCGSRQTESDLVDESIMSTAINAGNEEGLASSKTANTFSSVQEFLTNEHGRGVVADASGSNPVVSLMTRCNDAAPLSSTTCQLAIADNELDRLSPVRCQGVLSSGPFCSIEQTGVSAQQTIEEPPILQIPESTVHPQRLQDFFSERIPSMNLRGTGIQQVVGSADSLSSTVHTIVPAQHRILDVVAETGPSNHNITDNTLNPSTSLEDVPSERATSEHLRSTGVQLDQGNQLFPNFMSASWAPAQAVFADPFQNELFRIRKQNDSCSKRHEDKKVRLQVEFEREIEKLRRKYDSLLQDAEREHLRDKKMFQAIYDKVLLHKVFAEEVRFKFYDHKEGMSTPFRGPSLNLSQQLQTTLTPSQPQLPFRSSSMPPSIPTSTTSHPAPININQDSTSPLPTSIRPRTRMPSSSPNHLTGSSSHASPVFLSTATRGTPPRASLQVGRSPAPHLQRFRPNSSIPTSSIPHTPSTNQQSLPACQVSTSSPSVDLGSILPPALISTQPSIPQSCLNSQPANSRPSPPFSSSPVDQSTQDMEADLLESLLLNLPAMSNEFPTSSAVDSRPNASPDIIICLSDDD
ncbi:uncharacterized protein LOC110024818 isoform X2 [Phalaenopsis equestris]|uniref:uncharacterized protein LOC110024818 isoform X2 n=1 Tax=Phalaenopsis equestris TaxID=78828 RepID=UPI0009E1C3B2|nr:uncharacterized protein LOC110024818 isoform X2 [Phalaenopsis equestris]